MLTRKLLFFLLCIFSTCLKAQNFEIRTINKGFGVIGVQIRQIAGSPVLHTNYLTDMVFGMKWDTTYGVDLNIELTSSYNIKKSGSREQSGKYYFQAFYADNTPYKLSEDWTQNEWIEVLSVANTLTGVDTGTFRICEAGFNETTNPNIGIDLIDYTPALMGEAHGVVLPVTLLNFSVTPVNEAIRLNWSTTSEINNKGFDVQRSEENASRFVSIGFVNSRGGNGRNSYEFTDDRAKNGIHYYYRLKQLDINGGYRFSDTKDAVLNVGKNALVQLSPNPARSLLQLQFSNNCATKPVSVQIIDGKGAATSVRKELMQAGKKVWYNISHLPAGQYFLLIDDGGVILYKAPFQKM